MRARWVDEAGGAGRQEWKAGTKVLWGSAEGGQRTGGRTGGFGEGGGDQEDTSTTLEREALIEVREAEVVACAQAEPPHRRVACDHLQPDGVGCERSMHAHHA